MEISVNDTRKTVVIWLTNAEKNNETLKAELKPLYDEYRAKKYHVAVFKSGSQDVYQATSALLCYNRRHTASLETTQEAQQRNTMSR